MARVEITGPMTGAGGAPVAVETRVVVRSDGPRIVTHPATSELAILAGTRVVARATSAQGADVPLLLTAGRTRPAQTVPASIDLVGCDGSPLPAGTYQLRAVLGYGSDPLDNAAAGQSGRFVLVSEPVTLTVT